MARKNALINFPMFGTAGADMSLTSVTSAVTGVEYQDNIGIILSWTGTSPVGTLAIQVSTDYNPVTNNPGIWTPLDFGASIAITGNTGQHILNINQLPFPYIRAVYTKVSGVGTLTALITCKQIGG